MGGIDDASSLRTQSDEESAQHICGASSSADQGHMLTVEKRDNALFPSSGHSVCEGPPPEEQAGSKVAASPVQVDPLLVKQTLILDELLPDQCAPRVWPAGTTDGKSLGKLSADVA
eukprot:6634652-Karenia_brevis.AAC.1